MATRQSPAFAPNADSFTAFRGELDAELARQEKLQNSTWFSNAAKFLFSSSSDEGNQATTAAQFHELMVCALMTGNNIDNGDPRFLDDDNVERYIVAHLPNHLIRSQMFMKASELLLDRDFINRRVKALGCIEACKYQMFDLVGLRKDYHRSNKENTGDGTSTSNANAEESSAKSGESSGVLNTQIETIDAGKTVREGSRRIADAIRLVERNASPSGKTIELAVCLSTIGEGLLKGRQTKESIIRLEEALHMLRDLLGSYHVEVARALDSVAKAYIKAGDDVTSLSRLSEASRIYESCDAKQHYDSIANSQLMASLLVDNGNWEDAAMKYDEVILLKSRLYGEISVPVAKSMNDYAIVLAKHSRMSEALRQYETARSVFERLSSSTENNSDDNESAGVFAFDMTLIDLNIASIKSKLANYEGALESYERGVSGLRLHIKSEENGPEPFDPIRQAAQKRHLVSAIGRIGSLRMKLRDNAGALEAYLMLLAEVVKNSPLASQMEKAKAHVKCATIYRQMGSVDNNRRAVTHLKEAQMMYTEIHGVNHKDTRAISSSLKQWMKADKAS
jgi:tetratricopeptide (TPR) repeat protein